MNALADLLHKLETLIVQKRFEELESDTLELKPCASTGQDWSERYKSVNAFLNSRGGILILGIREIGQAQARRYEFTGYDPSAEPKLKELQDAFKDSGKNAINLADYLPPPEIVNFMQGRIAIQRVDELPAHMRYVFYKDKAYRRILTGDHALKQFELDRQTEFLEEISQARELDPLGNETINNVDLGKLNEYIFQINKLQKIENIKPTLQDAQSFLERKRFLIDDKLTVLGALVCGAYPGDLLGFRAHVHGYVDAQGDDAVIAQDKQDMVANVLELLEQANAYVLRNIQSGVIAARGGSVRAQYSEEVLRETINNAIAHRDYSLNKQIVIAIEPGKQLQISNPGKFKSQLLIAHTSSAVEGVVLRVVPETKPINPRLADVLRVYRKWEGRGIGMATLVNLCLANQLNLPYFKFKSDEVSLVLQAGRLVDEQMTELFQSRDAYIEKKLGSFEKLTIEMQAVLAYLIKSEWVNQEGKYCILLTSDNNHAQVLQTLESSGLIYRDSRSDVLFPVYLADRNLMSDNFETQLRERFGQDFDNIALLWRRVLAVIYRYNNFSAKKAASANQASFALWASEGRDYTDINAFENFKRNIRRIFNHLEDQGFIEQVAESRTRGFVLTAGINKNVQKQLF